MECGRNGVNYIKMQIGGGGCSTERRNVTVTVTGWYCTRRPKHCDHFWCIVRPHMSSYHFWFIHESSLAIANSDPLVRRNVNLKTVGRIVAAFVNNSTEHVPSSEADSFSWLENCSPCMKPKGLLPCILTRYHYWSTSWAIWIHYTPSHFVNLNIHFNVIYPFTFRFINWSLSFIFSDSKIEARLMFRMRSRRNILKITWF
jgi:hypothetical protein